MSFPSLLRAWLIILPVMIANGMFRELVLRNAVGPDAAETLSVLLGMIAIVLLTRPLLRRLAGNPPAALLRASLTLVALTVAFEFLFGHYVDNKSWMELIENYFIWRGNLWPLALATLAFMPFLWGRWSRKESFHAR